MTFHACQGVPSRAVAEHNTDWIAKRWEACLAESRRTKAERAEPALHHQEPPKNDLANRAIPAAPRRAETDLTMGNTSMPAEYSLTGPCPATRSKPAEAGRIEP